MENKSNMPFGKKNYKLMLIGLVVLVIGFIVMSLDSTTFGFGFVGLTLGPMIVLAGFLIEIAAILHNPKED